VREMNLQYAGSEGALGDPYAFAANGQLTGQPPVFILNSEADFLRASGEAYANASDPQASKVTVETEPGTHHGHINGPDNLARSLVSTDSRSGSMLMMASGGARREPPSGAWLRVVPGPQGHVFRVDSRHLGHIERYD